VVTKPLSLFRLGNYSSGYCSGVSPDSLLSVARILPAPKDDANVFYYFNFVQASFNKIVYPLML
jgi:hypothetical protein